MKMGKRDVDAKIITLVTDVKSLCAEMETVMIRKRIHVIRLFVKMEAFVM